MRSSHDSIQIGLTGFWLLLGGVGFLLVLMMLIDWSHARSTRAVEREPVADEAVDIGN